jgi:hypothetical protein
MAERLARWACPDADHLTVDRPRFAEGAPYCHRHRTEMVWVGDVPGPATAPTVTAVTDGGEPVDGDEDYDSLAYTACEIASQLWDEGGHGFETPGDALEAAIYDLTAMDADVDETRLREALDDCEHPIARIDWDSVRRGMDRLRDFTGETDETEEN